MKIYSRGSRQVPSNRTITTEKDYCDLLYAYLQCNSERVAPTLQNRKIDKRKCKFIDIEKAFTRVVEGVKEKAMSKYTISKYFKKMLEMGLIYEDENDPEFYYLTLLEPNDANLIEYRTLEILMNTMQRYSVSVYVYLYNRYFANAQSAYILTIGQVKDFIGISNNTASNNIRIIDTFDVLQRIGLMSYELIWKDGKSFYQINWVRNELPGVK